MTSSLQIDANRRNAALSTGPVTPAGKAVSSRNALSHGLTTQNPLIPGESQEEFLAHCDTYRAAYARPDSSPDTLAKAGELAILHWRLRRVPAYESDLLSLEMETILHELESGDATVNQDGRFEARHLRALAFKRLVEKRILTNLYAQEARLTRRASKLAAELLKQHDQTPQAAAAPAPAPVRKIEPNPIAPRPAAALPKPATFVHAEPKVGRNEPCPCGSGAKFKRCCGNPVHSGCTATGTAAAA